MWNGKLPWKNPLQAVNLPWWPLADGRLVAGCPGGGGGRGDGQRGQRGGHAGAAEVGVLKRKWISFTLYMNCLVTCIQRKVSNLESWLVGGLECSWCILQAQYGYKCLFDMYPSYSLLPLGGVELNSSLFISLPGWADASSWSSWVWWRGSSPSGSPENISIMNIFIIINIVLIEMNIDVCNFKFLIWYCYLTPHLAYLIVIFLVELYEKSFSLKITTTKEVGSEGKQSKIRLFFSHERVWLNYIMIPMNL